MKIIAQRLSQEQHFFAEAREQFEEIIEKLMSEELQDMTHSEAEQFLKKEGMELLRRLFQGYLDGLGDGTCQDKVYSKEGCVLTHRVKAERPMESLFGTVWIDRYGYRQRENNTVYPLDAHLNLPTHRYSHGVERRAVEEAVKNSFDTAVEALIETTGAKVPKRQCEEIIVRAAKDFDAYYEEVERKIGAESSPILVLTADAKGVVMRNEDLRGVTKKAAESKEKKLTTRLSRGEKSNCKRMAEVAAVYTIKPHQREIEDIIGKPRLVKDDAQPAPKPENKRVWASIEKSPGEVINEAFLEGLRRDPGRSKEWVVLVDGNRTQLKLFTQLGRAYGIDLTIVVDFVHVLEYLWRAGNALLGDGLPETEEWVLERAKRVLMGEASYVAAGIRRMATCRNLEGIRRKQMDRCADYLLKNAKYLRYDQCLAKGYPIATGVIEGACRYLVKDRMDITGARWRMARAEAILKLRALKSSGDFEVYWKFHEQKEQERNHFSKYAKGQPSAVVRKRQPKLRLVK